MAARIIGGSWWIDFHFNDTRYRKRSPESSRAGAQAYEAALRHRLALGENIDAAGSSMVRPENFRTFAQKWFDEYVRSNNKPSEQKAKGYILTRSLTPFFGAKSLCNITANEVERFKAHEARRGLSNKTINNKLAVLRKCLVSAQEWGYLRTAFPKINFLKCTPPKTDHLTLAENEKLLSHAEGIMKEMILVALRTGLRQGELRGLQWESVDWENQLLVVRHSLCDYTKQLTSPKSNRERYIPLTDEVFELLAEKKEDSGHVFKDSNGRAFRGLRLERHLDRIRREAGLRKVGWHTLRHTFATHLAANGVPLRVVQELLGHSTVTMTMRYSHVAPDNLRAAIQSLGSHKLKSGVGSPWAIAVTDLENSQAIQR